MPSTLSRPITCGLLTKVCTRFLPASYASDWHDWARESGATHTLTVTLGVWPSRTFDPEASFRPELKKLFRAITHEVRGVPKRHLHAVKAHEVPWFAGMVERTTRSGADFPHIHGYIALDRDEEPLMRGVLRTRWGKDEDSHLPAHVYDAWGLSVDAPSESLARRAVFKRPGCEPSFCLRPLSGPGWSSYAAKKAEVRSALLWTTSEILN